MRIKIPAVVPTRFIVLLEITCVIFNRFIMGLVNGTMSSGIALIVELAGKERSVAGMAYVDGELEFQCTSAFIV